MKWKKLKTTTNYGLTVTREDKENYYKAMENKTIDEGRTTVDEKPILFSTELVQAILDGHKTQTRRVMKPQPEKGESGFWEYAGAGWSLDTHVPVVPGHSLSASCPYGKPGDELWVRETFQRDEYESNPAKKDIIYRADVDEDGSLPRKWTPSIFMPRTASRIQLTVTDVRVERVQKISHGDAMAEGLARDWDGTQYWFPLYGKDELTPNPRKSFHSLWDSINADRGYSWESNPWVWVVEFEVKEVNG